MHDLTGKQVLVLGLGISGLAAAELAALHQGQVTVLDSASGKAVDERAARLQAKGIGVRLEWQSPTWASAVDLAVISPGIPATSPLGRLAASLTCPVLSELEFGYAYCRCPVIAITGTNGKTTTTELTTHCLKGAGKRALAAGNIGLPLSEAGRRSERLDFIVAEVSSFQLEGVDRFAPVAAACLNVTSDHLNRYRDANDYLQTKLRLFARLTDPGQVVLKRELWDVPAVRQYPLFAHRPPVTFSAEDGAVADYFVDAHGQLSWRHAGTVEVLLSRTELKLSGQHNLENVMAALALCRLAGVPHAATVEPAKRFAPSAHRLELVAVNNGVRYLNDSKATNPDALLQALRTCGAELRNGGRILLIAGGRDKRMDFEPVVPLLKQLVKEVYLLGESKDHLARLWSPHVACQKYNSLAAIVERTVEEARSGDIVLLSPGCASQDMFEDYADRGNQFCTALRRRLGE